MKLHTAIIGITFLISSCTEKPEIVQQENFQSKATVENGHLAFKTFSDFSKFQDQVNSMSRAERTILENKLGYKSLATLYEEVNTKIETLSTETEIEVLVKSYSEYFTYDEKGLAYKNLSNIFAKILDKDGLFKAGDALYKSIDGGRIISTTTEYELLQSINSVNDYILKGNDNIKIDWYQSKQDFVNSQTIANAAGPTTSGNNQHYLISVHNESNNRKLYVDMIQYIGYFPQYAGPTYTGFGVNDLKTLGFSHKKKGAFGVWGSYTSPTYISELSLFNAPQNVWKTLFVGNLDNNSSQQSYNDGLYFGYTTPIYFYSASRANNWVEPVFGKGIKLVCTGNGQNWYTNTY